MSSGKSRSRLVAACRCLLSAAWLTGGGDHIIAQEQGPPEAANPSIVEESVPWARQNTLLRDFFRLNYPRFNREPPVAEFVEKFVDNQIDAFLKEIDGNLTELVDLHTMVVKLRARWIAEPKTEKGREAAVALSATLRRLGDRSDDLADRLSMILVGIGRNKKLEFSDSSADDPSGLEREFAFLATQITEADRLVRDYFFRTTNTVELTDLGSENMLVRLDWAEFMAKELAKRVPAK